VDLDPWTTPLSTTGIPYPGFLSRPTSSTSSFDARIKCVRRLL